MKTWIPIIAVVSLSVFNLMLFTLRDSIQRAFGTDGVR